MARRGPGTAYSVGERPLLWLALGCPALGSPSGRLEDYQMVHVQEKWMWHTLSVMRQVLGEDWVGCALVWLVGVPLG